MIAKLTAFFELQVEEYIQTSPISPFKNRSPFRPISQLTQGTQTTNSNSEDESSSSERFIQNEEKYRKNRTVNGRLIRKRELMTLDDLRVPDERKRQKSDSNISPITAGRVLKKRRRVPPMSSPAAREHTSLKVRVLSLQQQVFYHHHKYFHVLSSSS